MNHQSNSCGWQSLSADRAKLAKERRIQCPNHGFGVAKSCIYLSEQLMERTRSAWAWAWIHFVRKGRQLLRRELFSA
jgi:hypothetical protein